MIINISVKNRVATYLHTEEAPVCGNSTDQVKFLFDEEWSAHEKRTARFFWGNQYHEEPFTGDTCPLPMFIQTNRIQIGVYAGVPMEGETSLATTKATVPYLTSVHCTEAQPTAITVEGYVHEAKVAALEAESFAQEAEISAGNAQSALDQINVVIENVSNTASFALQEASTANAESADAKRRSETALANANEAKRMAQDAQSSADAANETANGATSLANEAKELAAEAADRAEAAGGLKEIGQLSLLGYDGDDYPGHRNHTTDYYYWDIDQDTVALLQQARFVSIYGYETSVGGHMTALYPLHHSDINGSIKAIGDACVASGENPSDYSWTNRFYLSRTAAGASTIADWCYYDYIKVTLYQ